jgi:hypothetical protein
MLKTLAACVICLLASPAAAAAEWHISPMIGLTFAGKTTLQDLDQATGKVHPNLALSGTLLGGGLLGVEALGSLTPGFFQTGDGTVVKESRAYTLMGNLVVTAPRRWTEYNLRPFVSGGFGLMRATQIDALEVLPASASLLGYNIGGGAIGFFSRGTGVRFDVRYYGTVHGSDRGPIALGDVQLRYMTASVGLVIRR